MTAATVEHLPPRDEAAPVRRRRLPLPGRAVAVLALALVAAAGGGVWLRAAKASVSTDNAYLKTDSTSVAPRVRGLVAQVLVSDNQAVRAGQPLIRLDPEEYAAQVAARAGDLAMADAAVTAAEAALARLGAENALAAAGIREAETAIAAEDAQSERAQADWKRYAALLETGAVARRDAERVRAEAVSAQAAAARSRAALSVSRNQAAVTESRRAELTAAVQQARAARARAAAALDLARQDEAHTVIRAPVDGVVGDRRANPGDYVQPGTRLLTLVPMNTLYVTANFKETQTSRMLRGQPARVRIDALPGVVFKARVDSFAPGSGSEFALLPFEPGTGNFTKIVQRVPVRLRLEPGQRDVERLRPGLSAKVTVALE